MRRFVVGSNFHHRDTLVQSYLNKKFEKQKALNMFKVLKPLTFHIFSSSPLVFCVFCILCGFMVHEKGEDFSLIKKKHKMRLYLSCEWNSSFFLFCCYDVQIIKNSQSFRFIKRMREQEKTHKWQFCNWNRWIYWGKNFIEFIYLSSRNWRVTKIWEFCLIFFLLHFINLIFSKYFFQKL